MRVIFVLGAVLTSIASASSENEISLDMPVIETSMGKLLGDIDESRLGNKFYAFKGIPYAKSPERFQVQNIITFLLLLHFTT